MEIQHVLMEVLLQLCDSVEEFDMKNLIKLACKSTAVAGWIGGLTKAHWWVEHATW
jgi:hypothetical protein